MTDKKAQKKLKLTREALRKLNATMLEEAQGAGCGSLYLTRLSHCCVSCINGINSCHCVSSACY
jgi:hypothetical protein